jgi:rhamnogalacturonyl hydrolase YesR
MEIIIKMKRMQKIFCGIVTLAILTITSCKSSYVTSGDKKLVNKVVDWQINHVSDSIAPITGWVYGAMYKGMAEWARETNSTSMYDYLYRTSEQQHWSLLPRVYDADDLCIGQTYFELYDKHREDKMIRNVEDRINFVMAHADTSALINAKGKYNRNRWGWCDALFMAPPVYAKMYQKTGDKKYLDYCLAEYKVTTDSLFDKSAGLFYRDLTLVDSTNSRGDRVFWGRGNGWVYAGLAFLLNTVPKTHPGYNYYHDLYLTMTRAIVACQDNSGTWHSSLLEKETYPQPENSATGFFVFGLAWGVNNGVLVDPSHKQAAVAGWRSLQKYIDADGKLGYVQQVGHAPVVVKPDMTAPYGTGAYLLAASEMHRMKKK